MKTNKTNHTLALTRPGHFCLLYRLSACNSFTPRRIDILIMNRTLAYATCIRSVCGARSVLAFYGICKLCSPERRRTRTHARPCRVVSCRKECYYPCGCERARTHTQIPLVLHAETDSDVYHADLSGTCGTSECVCVFVLMVGGVVSGRVCAVCWLFLWALRRRHTS